VPRWKGLALASVGDAISGKADVFPNSIAWSEIPTKFCNSHCVAAVQVHHSKADRAQALIGRQNAIKMRKAA
jgi:hypothetical protein